MWHSASILTSGLGVLLFLLTLGAALFNVKRLAMGRLHKGRNKNSTLNNNRGRSSCVLIQSSDKIGFWCKLHSIFTL